jgi:hypothetical protein
MIAAILTARLVYWRTVQTWHALAAGWPALTKNGRTRRRRHRAELRRVRAYVRYLAADRAQILENMAQTPRMTSKTGSALLTHGRPWTRATRANSRPIQR